MADLSEFESFVTNCYVEGRDGDGPLFFQTERPDGRGALAARLDGYVIIPKERYESLVALEEGRVI